MPNRENNSEHTYDFLTDEELFDQFHKKNNHKAFELLYQRYAHLMYGVCMKYLKDPVESKDALMAVMEQLIANPPADKIISFSSYIYRITRNNCLDILKKKGIHTEMMKNWVFDEKYFLNFMESDYLNRLNKDRVNQAVQKLKPEQAACIRLFYYQNLSYQEIVTETGFNVNQVKSHLQNGKRKLAQLISKF